MEQEGSGRWASRTTRASGAGVEARRGGACGHGQRRRSARRDGHRHGRHGDSRVAPQPTAPTARRDPEPAPAGEDDRAGPRWLAHSHDARRGLRRAACALHQPPPSPGPAPTADREAIRLLARLENQGPRRGAASTSRGEASDLLPLLKGRRVIVEPQMMELRFGDEPLRPRFDPRALARTARKSWSRRPSSVRATRASSRRRSGAWFEGSPGWYVDAQEGWARPIDRRVSPAAIRRLLRACPSSPSRSSACRISSCRGCPKVALEVGAELPELSQVADVVDLVPDVPRARPAARWSRRK